MKMRIIAGLSALVFSGVFHFGSVANPVGAPFRTLHQFNLTTIGEETRLLAVLEEFNQLFAKLGYPEVRYRLWRVQEGGPGQLNYLYDSLWPDRATYDKVHQDSGYKALLEKHLPFLQQILKDEVYYKYVELGTRGPKK